MGEDKSRLRQTIEQVEQDRDAQLEAVLGQRGPLIRGSVVKRKRVCGHPGCRCATQGRLHASFCLSVAIGGKTRTLHLPAEDEQHVRQAAQRYRRFRRARSRLVRLGAKQAGLVDRLGNALLESYPAGTAIEPPARRGPKARQGRQDRSR